MHIFNRYRMGIWAAESLLLALKQRLESWLGQNEKIEKDPKRLLVLGYGAIGDILFLWPTLHSLRNAYPNAHITFLANRSPVTLELIPSSGLADEIDFVDWEKENEAARRTINMRLAGAGYDVIVLSPSAPAHFFQRALVKIPVRVGHCFQIKTPPGYTQLKGAAWNIKRMLVTGELSRRLLLNRKAWVPCLVEHALHRNLRLLNALGIASVNVQDYKFRMNIPDSARRFADRELGAIGRSKRVGIHLGVPKNPYFKIWPAERFALLCRRLQQSGDVECILLGGPQETISADIVRESADAARSWVGRCDLMQTLALISRLDLLISCDTGLAKAAIALGIPTTTLWGPTDPLELGAPGNSKQHFDLRTGIFCSPCVCLGMPYPRTGIDYTTCGHHNCLNQMEVEWVWTMLREKYPHILS